MGRIIIRGQLDLLNSISPCIDSLVDTHLGFCQGSREELASGFDTGKMRGFHHQHLP